MNRKRIAVIFQDDYFNPKGSFNATRSRIKYLHQIADYDIDVFFIQSYDRWYVRLLRRLPKRPKLTNLILDGITYNVIIKNFSLVDYFLTTLLRRRALFTRFFNQKVAKLLRGYDLISAHSTAAGLIAKTAHDKANIPFVITWHGSDIHTLPFTSKSRLNSTRKLLETADNNFFVSSALMECAKSISNSFKGCVLYNGVGEKFCKYSDLERVQLRKQFHVDESKVIAYVGNLVSIKNVALLPGLFKEIRDKSAAFDVVFWIIGDGKMRSELQLQMQQVPELQYTFWGNIPPETMPNYYNSMDLLVLPSKNEGLPLVTVEAMKCGVPVIGSNVGGIPEVIGNDNVFNLGNSFIAEMSDRAIEVLSHNYSLKLKDCFDWSKTAQCEDAIYKDLMK